MTTPTEEILAVYRKGPITPSRFRMAMHNWRQLHGHFEARIEVGEKGEIFVLRPVRR